MQPALSKPETKNKSSRKPESEKPSEDECFVCSDGGELMVCDVKGCPKVYHLECVGLTEWPTSTFTRLLFKIYDLKF